MLEWKITVVTPKLRYEKVRLRATMKAAGTEIIQVTRKLIKSGAKTGRRYRRWKGGPWYTASAPGQAPADRTGQLVYIMENKVYRNGMTVNIREGAPYAWILEHGRNSPKRQAIRKGKKVGVAIGLAPRPSLTAALKQRGPAIERRIYDSVALDLKFVRVKP